MKTRPKVVEAKTTGFKLKAMAFKAKKKIKKPEINLRSMTNHFKQERCLDTLKEERIGLLKLTALQMKRLKDELDEQESKEFSSFAQKVGE